MNEAYLALALVALLSILFLAWSFSSSKNAEPMSFIPSKNDETMPSKNDAISWQVKSVKLTDLRGAL